MNQEEIKFQASKLSFQEAKIMQLKSGYEKTIQKCLKDKLQEKGLYLERENSLIDHYERRQFHKNNCKGMKQLMMEEIDDMLFYPCARSQSSEGYSMCESNDFWSKQSKAKLGSKRRQFLSTR